MCTECECAPREVSLPVSRCFVSASRCARGCEYLGADVCSHREMCFCVSGCDVYSCEYAFKCEYTPGCGCMLPKNECVRDLCYHACWCVVSVSTEGVFECAPV